MTRLTNLIASVDKTVLFQEYSMKSLGRMSQTAQGDALSPLLFNFALEYAIRRD
jgi:hypothetical protein